MLKNIKYYFAALVLMVGPTSCLEKLPGSSIPEGEAMQTFSDAEQVVTGIYVGLKSSALFSGSLTVMPDIQADLVYAVENFTNVYGSVWQWDILSTDSDVESVYAAFYTIIARCNFYLDSIDEVMANELDVTNLGYLETYTGEVYTIRALCYSKLLECFSKAYDPATAENELGVVLRTKYSEPEPMKRASLKDSYDLVIDDLEHAEEYLARSTLRPPRHRPSMPAWRSTCRIGRRLSTTPRCLSRMTPSSWQTARRATLRRIPI